MRRQCGGCEGQGAHWRWCPWVVGANASLMGQQADRVESLGDSVGANEPGAANHLYAAAGLLREGARRRAEEYQRQGGVRRDGKKS